jgi:hypothetical protein
MCLECAFGLHRFDANGYPIESRSLWSALREMYATTTSEDIKAFARNIYREMRPSHITDFVTTSLCIFFALYIVRLLHDLGYYKTNVVLGFVVLISLIVIAEKKKEKMEIAQSVSNTPIQSKND